MNKHEFIPHTESTYSQQQYNNKSKYSSTVTMHKQKRCPTKTDTRQHLRQFYLEKTRHPQSFTQSPKKKKVVTSLVRVVPLLRPQPRVPPVWCPDQLVPRVSRAVCSTVRTGFLGEPFELHRYLGADGVGKGRRSAPRDPREDTLVFKKNPRTDDRNPDLSLSASKRPSLTPSDSLQARKGEN